jgi:hypothetical protein
VFESKTFPDFIRALKMPSLLGEGIDGNGSLPKTGRETFKHKQLKPTTLICTFEVRRT